MAQTNLKFIDLFAGIGGFHIGFKNAGYECVMVLEVLQKAPEENGIDTRN